MTSTNIPAALAVTLVATISLKPYPRNARKHSKAQLRQLGESITKFGFISPVLLDENNMILAGHGRVEAARLLGLTEVPVIKLLHLSDLEKRAYVIADNRLAERSDWDTNLLALEFKDLLELGGELDLSVTGFEIAAIDLLVHDLEQQDPDDGEELPPVPEKPVTRVGDLWQLGSHRILCGNSLMAESYQQLLGTEKAQMVFTDPPYNVPIAGHVSGKGEVKHAEFAMASGEMDEAGFTAFLAQACRLATNHSLDGALHYVCMDWRHIGELLGAGKSIYSELKNLCVWAKDNGGMGSLYRSRHELVFVFKHGTAPHINNVELGKHGRNRTNVWNYRGVNTLKKGRASELAMHPTVKPVRMVADALLDASHREGLVLDPFGGSGSTLIAAQKTSRRARLIELEPRYVDVTIRRWQELTGQEAVLEGTGQTFNAVKEEQGND